MQDTGSEVPPPVPLEGVRHIIAVASAKGGVGKSTVAVNLALALDRSGARTGILDADIYGPSVPLLLDLDQAPRQTEDGRVMPVVHRGVAVMSIGLLAQDNMPVIWRGPLLARTLQQFLSQVTWGDLEYLVIDLPPGTGDTVLTLCQSVELRGAVMVTTPQDVALQDVERGIAMFERVAVDVLGVVENMSYFVCPHCGQRHEVFGHGGGRAAADRLGLELLAEIPLDPVIREDGDEGLPVVWAAPGSEQATRFQSLAERVVSLTRRLEREA